MERVHHSLEVRQDSTLIKIVRIIFGLVCIAVAVFWLIYNFSSMRSDNRLWLTVIFLSGFGVYLAWTGLGYGYRFIEMEGDRLIFRKNSFLKKTLYTATELSKIEFFPLKVVIYTSKGEKNLIRFGVSEISKVEKIKDDIMTFATEHGIETELINEQ